MNFFQIEPEVAGGLGEHTLCHYGDGKFVVERLHYIFDGWLGDALVESVPCYIATKSLAEAIRQNGLTGIVFDEVLVTTSHIFQEIYPHKKLPLFEWLKIVGKPGQDDFAVGLGLVLLVSQRALDILIEFGIAHAEIGPYVC